jgi:hypothetical protein
MRIKTRGYKYPLNVADLWEMGKKEPVRTAHPRYRPPFNNRFRDERYPTPYGSMGARVPGEHRNEQHSSAVEAGWGGPNGPTPSRLIYTNCDRTPDTSLISWGLK